MNVIESIKEKLFKSPMNYLGNKYRLLQQILPLLPNNIECLHDVFCGGLDISLNVSANTTYANDKHEDLIWLYKEIIKYNSDILGNEIDKLDKKYFPMNEYNGKALMTYDSLKTKSIYKNLLEEKKKIYYKLRDDFNKGNFNFKILLLLIFNSVGLVEYRVVNKYVTYTCGKTRVNKNIIKSLNQFASKIGNINFTNKDFRYLYDIEFKENDFVYLDPPYLGTSQYKIKWTEQDEQDLYKLLDYLHSKNVKFALSNFADGINHTNEYLAKWCGKYNIHKLDDNHYHANVINKTGEKQEILITNYIL